MLKKSKIAMAVTAATFGALGVANTAQAVYVSENRLGEVNILPYYNVNNNFLTQISITNTTNLYKVVKVRFRESSNSQDVLDFNIYMSPFDQWTGSVRPNFENGLANLVTIDETCTYPPNSAFKGDGQNFIELYDNVEAADVTEGYVEIYDIGTIADGPGPANDLGMWAVVNPNSTNVITPAVDTRVIVRNIDHGTTGVPTDCSVVVDAWQPINRGFTKGLLVDGMAFDLTPFQPYEFDVADPLIRILGANDGLVRPTGGISAYSILINANTGAAFVQEATALNNYATVAQHYRSDDQVNYLLPSLASGNVNTSTWMTELGLGVIPTVNATLWPLTYFDTGALVDVAPNANVPMGANPFPVAAVMTVTSISNDFFVDPAISGSTDWVVTFPMRKHGIYNGATLVDDLDGAGVLAACIPGTQLLSSDTIVDRWPTVPVTLNVCDNAGYFDNIDDDVEVAARYWNQEELEVIPDPDDPIVSPPIQDQPDAFLLNREVNVVTFARANESPDSVLGSPAARVFNLEDGFIVGWAQIVHNPRYNYGLNVSIEALVDPTANIVALPLLDGVPTLGFAALEGLVGPASVGETVQYTTTWDRGLGSMLPGGDAGGIIEPGDPF